MTFLFRPFDSETKPGVRLRLSLPVLLWLIYRAKKATAIKGLYVFHRYVEYSQSDNKSGD
jgi:hypothetical protein